MSGHIARVLLLVVPDRIVHVGVLVVASLRGVLALLAFVHYRVEGGVVVVVLGLADVVAGAAGQDDQRIGYCTLHPDAHDTAVADAQTDVAVSHAQVRRAVNDEVDVVRAWELVYQVGLAADVAAETRLQLQCCRQMELHVELAAAWATLVPMLR